MAISLRRISDGSMYAGGPGGDYYSMAMPGVYGSGSQPTGPNPSPFIADPRTGLGSASMPTVYGAGSAPTGGSSASPFIVDPQTLSHPGTPAQQQGYFGTALAQPTDTRASNSFTAPSMLTSNTGTSDTRQTNPFLAPTGLAGSTGSTGAPGSTSGGTPYNPAGDGYTNMTGNYTVRNPVAGLLSQVNPADLMALRTLGSSSNPTQTLSDIGDHLRALGMSEDQISQIINQGPGAGGQGVMAATNGLASQLSSSSAPFSVFNGTSFAPQYANAANGLSSTGGALPGGSSTGATPTGDNFPGVSPTGSANPALDVNAFLDPSLAYREDQAMKSINNSAAARGNLQSGATLKAISDRVSGMAGDAYQNAVQNAMQQQGYQRGVYTNDRDYNRNVLTGDRSFAEGQREFNTGVDQNDRQFFYNADVNDQNTDLQRQLALAQLGLQGSTQDATTSRLLATLQAQLGTAGANAQGAGTMGQSNAINNTITQILAYLSGNSAVNQVTGH